MAIEKSLIFIELTQEWLQMQYLEAAQRQAVARLGGQPLPSLPEPQEALEDEDHEEIVGEVVEEELPPEPPPEMPPFPDGMGLTVRDSSFFEAVVKNMDYENVGKVKEALLNITGNSRREDTAMPAYWQWLWEYKMAPAQEELL